MVLTGFAAAAILAIVIAVVVVVEKENRYPDYTTLNYTLVDRCQYSQTLSPFSIQLRLLFFSFLSFFWRWKGYHLKD